jgi:hypothetical protein
MNDDARELLALLLARAEQHHHAARPQRAPFRFYVRRSAHRTLPIFAPHAHNRCRG